MLRAGKDDSEQVAGDNSGELAEELLLLDDDSGPPTLERLKAEFKWDLRPRDQPLKLPLPPTVYDRLFFSSVKKHATPAPSLSLLSLIFATSLFDAIEPPGSEYAVHELVLTVFIRTMRNLAEHAQVSGFHFRSNVAEASLTTGKQRPDFIATYRDALLMKGEEKADIGGFNLAKSELVEKMAEWSSFYHGDQVRYLLCYAAAGSRFQIFALGRSDGVLHALTEEMDLLQPAGRLAAMRAAVTCMAVMIKQSRDLPEYVPVGRKSVRPNGTTITFEGSYVAKEVKTDEHSWFDDERVEELRQLYQSTAAVPFLVHAALGTPKYCQAERRWTVRLTPVGTPLGARGSMLGGEAGLKACIRCVLTALEGLHAAGWGHGDIRWANIVQTGESFCLIDLECAVRLGEVPTRKPTPDQWQSADVLVEGRYTAASDLAQVGGLMAGWALSSEGSDLQRRLAHKSITLHDALRHAWLSP